MGSYSYKVVPIFGVLKSGDFSKDNAQAVSVQLQKIIDENTKDGWEFYSIEKIGILTKPGCLASFGGTKNAFNYYDQIIFRK
jgi:hypothetical protein